MNDSNLARTTARTASPPLPTGVERQILDAVADIRYGSVVISIQDGRVVQIESTEKQRINS